MDLVFTDLLTADDMRCILKQRELKIPNIDQMSYDDLRRIFNSFVVPLERRCERKQKNNLHHDTEQTAFKHKRVLPPPVGECAKKLSKVTLNINVSENSTAKRTDSVNNLAVGIPPCKRMKITWP